MLIRAAAIALTCALVACAARHAGHDGAPSREAPATMNPELRATQLRLVEQDRIERAKRHAEVARVASGTARDVTPAGSTVERLIVTVTNRGTRAIARVDGGVAVYDGASLKRMGLSTFSAAARIEPGRTVHIAVAIPMGAFAEGAGPLARSAGKAKRVELELTGFGFASGRDAGERD